MERDGRWEWPHPETTGFSGRVKLKEAFLWASIRPSNGRRTSSAGVCHDAQHAGVVT